MRSQLIFICMVVCTIVSSQNIGFVGDTAHVQGFNQAWTGGLSNCTFGNVDVNCDSKNDIVAFDNFNNLVLCFVDGIFTYKYSDKFPTFSDWCMLVDFNNDGKTDLFMYDGYGGIKVFKNTSQTDLSFTLYNEKIEATMFGNSVPIYCSSVDYPAITDVDDDGDPDIITFWVPSASNTLFWYKNMSMELYGNADSLVFELADEAFGNFKENDMSNEIELLKTSNNTIDANQYFRQIRQTPVLTPKHTGSTIAILDLNNDGNKDILLGDFGYPNIVALYTDENNHISHIDTAFPSDDTSVRINSFPAINLIKENFISQQNNSTDEQPTLVFSPFMQSDFDNNDEIWMYKKNDDKWIFQSKKPIQGILDFGTASSPAIADINNDGLLDIVVASFNGQISTLINIGTKDIPAFQLKNIDIEHVDIQGARIVIDDIDNNNNLDLLIGSAEGNLYRFEQIDNYKFILIDTLINKDEIGKFLAPALYDINNDGLLDLIVGEQRTIWRNGNNTTYKGNLNYFQNTGSLSNPVFTFITDSFAGIDAIDEDYSNLGYATPCFVKNYGILLGSHSGKIKHYNIDDFTYNTTLPLYDGRHSTPASADLNNDNIPDLIIGNQRGGLTLYFGKKISENEEIINNSKCFVYPNPANEIIFYNCDYTSYKIFDMQGNLVNTGRNTGTAINTSKLNTGAYIIVFDDKKGIVFVK